MLALRLLLGIIVVLLIVYIIYNQQCTKSNFINGLWQSKNGIYIYLDNNKGYIVSEADDGIDINEPFTYTTKIGALDSISFKIDKNNYLSDKFISDIDLSKGKMTVDFKNGKTTTLYKDNLISDNVEDFI